MKSCVNIRHSGLKNGLRMFVEAVVVIILPRGKVI
jgi:hypothetical protein